MSSRLVHNSRFVRKYKRQKSILNWATRLHRAGFNVKITQYGNDKPKFWIRSTRMTKP